METPLILSNLRNTRDQTQCIPNFAGVTCGRNSDLQVIDFLQADSSDSTSCNGSKTSFA